MYQHVDCVMIYILSQVSFNLLVGHVLWQSWETGLENRGSYLDGDHLQGQVSVDDVLSLALKVIGQFSHDGIG